MRARLTRSRSLKYGTRRRSRSRSPSARRSTAARLAIRSGCRVHASRHNAPMRAVIGLFVMTRIGLLATILAATVSVPPSAVAARNSDIPLLNALAQWDGGAYLYLAQHGYSAVDANYASYFPLYPLLMKVGGTLLGGSGDAYLVVGVLVANVAILAALAGLLRLGSHERATLVAAAGFILVFPTTIFLSAVYADAL